MATLLVVAGLVGIASQLNYVGVAHAATFTYCDCGYKTEEVIAQDCALSIGWGIQTWLINGAVALVAVGLAAAGRLVPIGGNWRLLSYAIAVILLLATAVRVLATFVPLGEFAFLATDLAAGLTLAILVPIWAILLARGAPSLADQPA